MNRQQTIAYEHPCFEAEETAHPRFRHAGMVNNVPISVILTLNIGLE